MVKRFGITVIIVLCGLTLVQSVQGTHEAERNLKSLERQGNGFLRTKYKFARVLGQGPCWICHNIHTGKTQMPLIAVPLNLSMLMNLTKPWLAVNVTEKRDPQIPIEVVGVSHRPQWCFRVGVGSRNGTNGLCSGNLLNITGWNWGLRNESRDVGTSKELKDYYYQTACPDCGNCNSSCWSTSKGDNCYESNQKLEHRARCYGNCSKNNTVCQDCLSTYTRTCWAQRNFTTLFYRLALYGMGATEPFMLGEGMYFCQDLQCRPYVPRRSSGHFYIAMIAPVYNPHNHSNHITYKGLPPGRIHITKRAKFFLFTDADKTWGWFSNTFGVTIELMNRLNNFSLILDGVLNETDEEVHLLNLETRQMRISIAVINMRVEMLEHAVSGLCEITEGGECCTWIHNITEEIPDYYEMIEQHRAKVHALQDEYRSIADDGWNPFKHIPGIGNFFEGIIGWIKNASHIILFFLMLLIGCYVLWRIGCCVFSRVTTVKTTPKPEMMTLLAKEPNQTDNDDISFDI